MDTNNAHGQRQLTGALRMLLALELIALPAFAPVLVDLAFAPA